MAGEYIEIRPAAVRATAGARFWRDGAPAILPPACPGERIEIQTSFAASSLTFHLPRRRTVKTT
jgi:hypothetical protein